MDIAIDTWQCLTKSKHPQWSTLNNHAHMVVGSPDGTTRAGHILAAYVSPTLEVMVTVGSIAMQKRLDPATDLTLIDPALK
jgi:uncharacterized protein